MIKELAKNFVYDSILEDYNADISFWQTVAGVPSVSTDYVRLNAAEIVSEAYLSSGFDLEFDLIIPVAPTAGDARNFGLYSHALGNRGRICFNTTGAVFKAMVYDNNGTALTLSNSGIIPWNAAWTAAVARYKIVHNGTDIAFFVNEAEVARYSGATPNIPLRLWIENDNADNLDMAAIISRNTQGFV